MARRKRALPGVLLLIITVVVNYGCQTGAPSEGLSMRSKQEPVELMVAVARNAQKCWFKSGDRAFRSFKIANETNSHSGRPRILLVPKTDPGGLPQLVVQAEKKGAASSGTFTNIQAYGPLLATSSGKRITDDVRRWSDGNAKCKGA